MPLYFLVHDAARFRQQLAPALAESWRRRSFTPCRPLCEELLPTAVAFAQRYGSGGHEPLLAEVLRGLGFDRDRWRALVGEVLVHGAAELPAFQTAPDTLRCLLAPERYRDGPGPREHFAPIDQAHFGSRDLVFGGYYRPGHAGCNDPDDVARLADYLAGVRAELWSVVDLGPLRDAADDDERADELEFAREWFPLLRELYAGAAERGQLIVCEIL